MTSVPVYCLCQLPYDVTRFMIECDLCQQWFHGSCVGVEEEKAMDIDVYHCPKCEILYGPSIMKKCHRSPMSQEVIVKKETVKLGQTGSPLFIQEPQHRSYHSTKKVSDFPRSRNSKAKMKVRSKPQHKLKISEQWDPGSSEALKDEETPEKEKALTSKKMLPEFHQKLLPASSCSDPKRIRKPGEVEYETEENYTSEKKVEEGVEAEAGSPGGDCGILYLLKTSRQLGEPDCGGHDKAPVSPNTLEAAQGLLSLANLQPASSLSPASSVQAWWASGEYSGSSDSPREKGSGPLASQGTVKKKALKQLDNYSTKSQEGEVKTLFLESDEDDYVSELNSKKKKKKSADDAPWTPKVQEVPSLPKAAREGTIASSMASRMSGTVTKVSQQERFSGSLADHEYTAQPKIFGMPQVNQRITPVAPGVFLSQQHSSVNSHGDRMAQGF